MEKVFLLCITLTCLTIAPALGCYSGLAVIPTAETVGDGQYGLEFQVDGATGGADNETYIINTQLGFGDRLEAGVDYDASDGADTRHLLNAKYLFAVSPKQRWAAAVGVHGAGRNLKASPYLVVTKDMSLLRMHVGAMRIEHRNRWFIGTDHSFSDRLTLMADYTNGNDNYFSAGINYQFSTSTGLMAALLLPNSGGDSTLTIHLVFGGSYRPVMAGG